MRRWLFAVLLASCTRGTEPESPPGDADFDEAVVDSSSDVIHETSADAPGEVAVDSATDVGDAESDAADAEADSSIKPSLLATFTANPRDVAAGAGYLFVTTFAGEIVRVPRDGGAPLRLASPEWPTYVSVDATHVYWTDLRKSGTDPGKIGRVPIGGGTEEILATDLQRPNSCALAGTRVFFAQFGTNDISSLLRTGGTVDSVAAAQTSPFYVAANGSLVCWVHHPGVPSISCKPQIGGTVSLLATESTGTIFHLAIDDTHAFWAMRDGSLRSVPLAGGTPTTLAPALDDCPLGADIELDGTRVYWSCGPNIRSVAKSGGEVTLHHRGTNAAAGIAVDATRVYWTTFTEMTLQSLPK